MLTEIKQKLEELDPNVFYGIVDKNAVEESNKWNYIVFGRRKLTSSQSRNGYTDYYWVGIVREDFVPEGLETQVIDKMLEIDGMKLAGTDGQYEYVMKPNTNTVIEVLTLEFARPKKRVIV